MLAPKSYRTGLSFTRKAPISDRFCAGEMLRCFGLESECETSHRIGFRDTFLGCVNREIEPRDRTETEVNNKERGLDSSGKMAAVLGHFNYDISLRHLPTSPQICRAFDFRNSEI